MHKLLLVALYCALSLGLFSLWNVLLEKSIVANLVHTKKTKLVASFNNEATLTSESTLKDRLKIVHLVSPYKVDNCQEQFCPFDQAQSVAIAAMQRARSSARNASVVLAAATFPDSLHIVPSDFVLLEPLNRSTASEYPNLILKKELPFVGDVFASLRTHPDTSSFDYMVYTNSDIIVREEFYDLVANVIESTQLRAFTINRQTIGKSARDGHLFTRDDLDEIFSKNGGKHPGSDCFVIQKRVYDQMVFGDLFLGFPPVANLLLIQAEIFSNSSFRMFKSYQLRATYHLGDDRNWQRNSKEMEMYRTQNFANVVFGLREVWQLCCEQQYEELVSCVRNKLAVHGGQCPSRGAVDGAA